MGARAAIFGRGDVVDRFGAEHPWILGAAGFVVMLVILAAIGLLFFDPIDWATTIGFSVIFAGTVVGSGYGRRRRLARGLR